MKHNLFRAAFPMTTRLSAVANIARRSSMARCARLLSQQLKWMSLCFAVVPASASAESILRLVHHGEMPSSQADDRRQEPIHLLIRIVQETCFERGGDSDALKKWADDTHWNAASAERLKAIPDNEFTQVTGGWTAATEIGVVAIIQSKIRGSRRGFVCSVTAKLPNTKMHQDFKSIFESQFNTTIAEEHDAPNQHTDRYWIERNKSPPVKASMVFTPSQSIVTIRMIHGDAWPLKL
ncbi:MAG: hypothetical protein CTY31_13980 [Hyphomicrobium sp.]|nr:MAG: hypothetical protein CTY31_13980 [Hyphomicrobium sp.]